MSEKRIKVWVQRFKDRPHLVLQWYDPLTRRRRSRSAGTADAGQAENARADLESDLNNGRHVEASRLQWQDFRELFEDQYAAGTRQSTKRNFADSFDLFEKLCNPGRLSSISARTLSTFQAEMRKLPGRAKGSKGMKASTIKVRLQFLRTALSWAVKNGFLTNQPEFPKTPVPEKTPEPVPPELFDRLLNKAKDQATKVFLLCGWLAGLRLSEAFHLEWESSDAAPWVNFARSRIVVPAEFSKSKKDGYVPLDPQLRQALESMPKNGRRVFRFDDRSGRLLTVNGVSERVTYLAKKAGVRLDFKALRRGFGCRYASRVPAQVLQKLLRHSNIRTTLTYYVNLDDAVDAAILGPAPCDTSRNKPIRDASNIASDDAVTP